MFRKIKPEEMWIAFGSGTNLRYIGVHQIANKLGLSTIPVMLSHYSMHSAFAGRGKKTAWQSWKAFLEVTDTYDELLQMLSNLMVDGWSTFL